MARKKKGVGRPFCPTRGGNDDIETPRPLARAILTHLAPKGLVLDPSAGSGAFYDEMVKLGLDADWCEIARGRDFFQHDRRVDWVIGNVPWSQWRPFLQHALLIATTGVAFLGWITHGVSLRARRQDVAEAGFHIAEVALVTPRPCPPWPQGGFLDGVVVCERGPGTGSVRTSLITWTEAAATDDAKPLAEDEELELEVHVEWLVTQAVAGELPFASLTAGVRRLVRERKLDPAAAAPVVRALAVRRLRAELEAARSLPGAGLVPAGVLAEARDLLAAKHIRAASRTAFLERAGRELERAADPGEFAYWGELRLRTVAAWQAVAGAGLGGSSGCSECATSRASS